MISGQENAFSTTLKNERKSEKKTNLNWHESEQINIQLFNLKKSVTLPFQSVKAELSNVVLLS